MALTPEQLAHLTKLSHLQSLASRTAAVVADLQEQIDTLGNDAITGVKVNGTALNPTEGVVDVLVGVVKKQTPNSGYAASYQITANGTPIATEIDIPKDWLLSGVTKDVVTAADKAEGGKFENDDDFSIGDKYIDFTFNVKAGGAETAAHIYLNVQELVDVYTSGNGIDVSNANVISVKLDTANANGLSVSANGLAMGLATDSAAGAMSAADHANFTADHTKLGGISTQANKTTVTTEGSGAIEIDGTSKTIVNFATDAEVEEAIDAVLPAPSNS